MAAVVLATFTDYGITWDEDLHAYYGSLVVDYYRSGLTDLRALTWWNLYEYGAAFDAPATLATEVSPFGYYETRHLLNAAVGLIGIVGTWKLARALAGPRAALWAALFLAFTPNYFGHMFNNPKDIPFAAGLAWALYYTLRLIPHLPRPPLSLALRLGLAFGFAVGVRVGGLIQLCYLGLLVAGFAGSRALAERSVRRFAHDLAVGTLRAILPAALVGYAVMLAAWPWAQAAPLANPLAALAEFSHHDFNYEVLFDGRYFRPGHQPWSYLPVHIALKLPELVVLMTLAAVAWPLSDLASRRSPPPATTVFAYGLVAVAALVPIAYAILIHAVVFNGMRHFLFVLPPLSALAGAAFERCRMALPARGWRPVAHAGLAAYLSLHVVSMVRLHPDEYVYYNRFIGGVDGAKGLFRLDYWANSYAEAVRGLERELRQGYGDEFEARRFRIKVCGPRVPAAHYFPQNFIEVGDEQSADFVIAMSNYAPSGVEDVELAGCRRFIAGRELLRVERDNALLSLVIDRRELKIERALAMHSAVTHRR